jgi:hypothetical protein
MCLRCKTCFVGDKEIDRLLGDLCIDLGFCLPEEERARLRASPPADLDSFTDAVIVAEGLDPAVIEKRLRAQVRERVEKSLRVR